MSSNKYYLPVDIISNVTLQSKLVKRYQRSCFKKVLNRDKDRFQTIYFSVCKVNWTVVWMLWRVSMSLKHISWGFLMPPPLLVGFECLKVFSRRKHLKKVIFVLKYICSISAGSIHRSRLLPVTYVMFIRIVLKSNWEKQTFPHK